MVVGLADLIDLVDVDDAALRALDIVIGRLQQRPDPGLGWPSAGRRHAGRPRRDLAKEDPHRSQQRVGGTVPAAVRDGEHRPDLADEARGAVARKAIEHKTGARGLRSILESILIETMFDLPGVEEVVISREVVEGTARPLYIYADRSVGKQRHGVLTLPN